MDVRGSEGRKDGVRILDTLGGVRPVADVNTSVKYQVGGAALQTRQPILTLEVFPARLGVGVQLIVLPTHDRLQSLSWLRRAGLRRPPPEVRLRSLPLSAAVTKVRLRSLSEPRLGPLSAAIIITVTRLELTELPDQLLTLSLELVEFVQQLLFLQVGAALAGRRSPRPRGSRGWLASAHGLKPVPVQPLDQLVPLPLLVQRVLSVPMQQRPSTSEAAGGSPGVTVLLLVPQEGVAWSSCRSCCRGCGLLLVSLSYSLSQPSVSVSQ